ncbi:hypothetical protein ABW20_dc0100240 [Dactylellina cionopaga]|nr:hypothetical protein ABW20_dc0100240 [Dactylellina cionopaga]
MVEILNQNHQSVNVKIAKYALRTITVTETETQTSLSYSTSTSTTTIPVTSTVTQPTTIVVTTGIVTTVTSQLNVPVRKRADTAVPSSYARQCGHDTGRFSSACACLSGFQFPSTITAPAASTATDTVTSTVSTTSTIVLGTTKPLTTTVLTTVFSTATSTLTTISSTVTLTPMYLRVKDGEIAGQYGFNTPDKANGNLDWAYLFHFTPDTSQRTLFHLHSDTGYIVDATTGWVILTDSSNPDLDVLSVFIVDPAHAPGFSRFVCSLSGTDISCVAGQFTEFSWRTSDDPSRPWVVTGKTGADFGAAFGTTQIHLQAVAP